MTLTTTTQSINHCFVHARFREQCVYISYQRVCRMSMSGMARTRIICNIKQKPLNPATNTLKAYLSTPPSLFQGFYDQQCSYTCPKALWKTAKHKSLWYCIFIIHSFFIQPKYLKIGLSTHSGCSNENDSYLSAKCS